MNIWWLEQTEHDMPFEKEWLSTTESLRAAAIYFPKRRNEWLLGRWTAKQALAAWLGMPPLARVLAKFEVWPANSGAPEAFIANQPAAVSLSLSHRNGRALCVLAPVGVNVGCDLEVIEPHSDAFIEDYFTCEEKLRIRGTAEAHRDDVLALFWSAKESALKALHEGLRLDTRCVVVSTGELRDRNGWSPVRVEYDKGGTYEGWWQIDEGAVRTVVAQPSADPPVHLEVRHYTDECTVRCA
jgi:4'-phosphopantetheinyl transferase